MSPAAWAAIFFSSHFISQKLCLFLALTKHKEAAGNIFVAIFLILWPSILLARFVSKSLADRQSTLLHDIMWELVRFKVPHILIAFAFNSDFIIPILIFFVSLSALVLASYQVWAFNFELALFMKLLCLVYFVKGEVFEGCYVLSGTISITWLACYVGLEGLCPLAEHLFARYHTS